MSLVYVASVCYQSLIYITRASEAKKLNRTTNEKNIHKQIATVAEIEMLYNYFIGNHEA